jgi:hypothetical protein
MKINHCLCFAVMMWAAASCQKEQENIPKLATINDNDHRYRVNYNGNSVSEIAVDSGSGAPYTIATYSYSRNFIRADLNANTGYSHIDYTLKNGTLPLTILKYKSVGAVDVLVSKVNFYYHNSSEILDSVVLDGATHYNFIPVYSSGNISDFYVCTDSGPPVLSGSFLYYPIGNVFKATNPLLFVYSSPVFEFETFLLPRIFSNSTMKKFNGGSFIYDTDAKGRLSLEDYGATYPYKRTYLYK